MLFNFREGCSKTVFSRANLKNNAIRPCTTSTPLNTAEHPPTNDQGFFCNLYLHIHIPHHIGVRHLLIEVDGGTVHVLVSLLEGELHGHLDLAGLREPGAEAEDGDVDPVVEGEGGGDVHVARPGC